MRTFRLIDGDLKDFRIIEGIGAVIQGAETRARTLRGEMVLAMESGVTYFRDAFGSRPNLVALEASLRARILQTPQIDRIKRMSVTQQGDIIHYTATLETPYGTIPLQSQHGRNRT